MPDSDSLRRKHPFGMRYQGTELLTFLALMCISHSMTNVKVPQVGMWLEDHN
jgi:hypothetical protein